MSNIVNEITKALGESSKRLMKAAEEGKELITFYPNKKIESINEELVRIPFYHAILEGLKTINYDENHREFNNICDAIVIEFEEKASKELCAIKSNISTGTCCHCGNKEADLLDTLGTFLYGIELVDLCTYSCSSCGHTGTISVKVL